MIATTFNALAAARSLKAPPASKPNTPNTMTTTLKRTACQAAAVCLFTTRCAFRQVKWKHGDSFIYRYESYSTKRTAVP